MIHRTPFFTLLVLLLACTARADETRLSPYIPKITGQEDFLYVWTLGVDGFGDEQDKLVTVDVRPGSPGYGKVIHFLSVGRHNEAHQMGLTDDRQFLWAAGLDTSAIFVFDVHTDPAEPKLVQTLTDFVADTRGMVGPHTLYALPGRMLITGLSNSTDRGGHTGMAQYSNDGAFLSAVWMPTAQTLRGTVGSSAHADGFGGDVRALPRLNALFTSSFTGWNDYMTDGKRTLRNPDFRHFGNSVVLWDLASLTPIKVFDVPGAPIEIRCALSNAHDYCFTVTALTARLHLIARDPQGEWRMQPVANIGAPPKHPLPVDMSISADDKRLWISTWNDGMAHLFDISAPLSPKEIYSRHIGEQVASVTQSWDGKRVYFTSSFLASWDKRQGPHGELQYLKGYRWDGRALRPTFALNFVAEKLGRPHQMVAGAYSLYAPPPTRPFPAPPSHRASGWHAAPRVNP